MSRNSRRKDKALALLHSDDLEALCDWALREHPVQRALLSLLHHSDEAIRWRAAVRRRKARRS